MGAEREVRRLMERIKPHFEKFQRENNILIEAIYFTLVDTRLENGELKYNQRIDVKLMQPEVKGDNI